MSRCLYCYKELSEGMKDFHPACARKFFGVRMAPELPYVRSQLGVQAKLSLDINRGGRNEPDRFTIVGLWGRFILKPQTQSYRALPELEDVTMHLAEAAKINVVPHSLIRFSDGELCYITRRIDRLPDGHKVAMEDMCQLSERLTEYKYKGSYEQIAKLIRRYSFTPQLDVINFWEVVVFCWITGNADMHEDTEELALTLNGKKNRLRKMDFYKAITASGVEEKVIENLARRFSRALPKWFELIDQSFLPDDMKRQYKKLILRRVVMLR